MTDRWNWRAASQCREADAEELFIVGAQQREVREFCRTCPVRTECLAHALDQRIEFGIWGGMTERQRRALLRARPRVTSWHELLTDARRSYYEGDPQDVDALAERATARLAATRLAHSA